ncbi:MAG: hypothetical protein JNJ54_15720 [Myxococcaceae bacterium]|nr:hypothetical protein [Myxococcaceae bacterium]
MRTLLLALALLAVTSFADVAPPMPARPLTPEPQRRFADGPRLDSAGLHAWLKSMVNDAGQPRRVRLPVLVKSRSPVGVERTAFVSSEKGLALELDDSAMGVGLADHYRRVCKGAPSCVLLLDGVLQGERGFRILWIQPVRGEAPTLAQVEVTG